MKWEKKENPKLFREEVNIDAKNQTASQKKINRNLNIILKIFLFPSYHKTQNIP